MIVANLATYPPRLPNLNKVVDTLSAQVDRLNIVLNEFHEVPVELRRYSNVVPIIPEEDTKDVGKFLPAVEGDDTVLLVDDDILYPKDFVEETVRRFSSLGDDNFVASYHGSTYRKPKMRSRELFSYFSYRSRLADFRKVSVFYRRQEKTLVVDQVATCAAILTGKNLPSYSYMRDSQKFVDVRLAKWAYEKGLTCVTLPREEDWLCPIRYEETIYKGFTQMNPPQVNAEIAIFAGKSSRLNEAI